MRLKDYPSRRRKMKPWFKANSMMQWIERNRNKIFVNLPSLPWKSVNFWSRIPSTTGSYSRQAGRRAGERVGGQAGTGEF